MAPDKPRVVLCDGAKVEQELTWAGGCCGSGDVKCDAGPAAADVSAECTLCTLYTLYTVHTVH